MQVDPLRTERSASRRFLKAIDISHFVFFRHCEEQSNEAIQFQFGGSGLLCSCPQ
jgi:hypothetical protein